MFSLKLNKYDFFPPLEVVFRYRDPQLKVEKKFNSLNQGLI